MSSDRPRITICIPHWQVKALMTLCLRSIRKHSHQYNLEVIVIDNGSCDDSLDYLRLLKWIRLVERPGEVHTNWPQNTLSAWDRGLQDATGEYFITMHSDVFVRRDDWLNPFLQEMNHDPSVAGVGTWKLNLETPLYAFQKKILGHATATIKSLFGRKKTIAPKEGHYPRDYCAMYRRNVILKHNFTFHSVHGGGGYGIAKQLWDAGYSTRMVPVHELAAKIVHVAHGTAAVVPEKPLRHKRTQRKAERKVAKLFSENWIEALRDDASLDLGRPAP
ncbi:MAG: glycosyltransferase family 2 protein [candidate division NC10 bacterium]